MNDNIITLIETIVMLMFWFGLALIAIKYYRDFYKSLENSNVLEYYRIKRLRDYQTKQLDRFYKLQSKEIKHLK